MEIKEIENTLKVKNSENNLDKKLKDDIPEPLPNYSGFNMVIAGASGSGKTTLLYSLMTRKKFKGKRTSYRKAFDHIYIVSPTMAKSSIKNDPFTKGIKKNQIYRTLDLETLNELEEILEENRDEEENSVIIFDDVGSQLRKSAAVEKKLTQIVQNRRHLFCSTIFLVQRFRDIGTGIRNNMSHFITFRPKNLPEEESIMKELFPFSSKDTKKIFDYVFERDEKGDKYSFLFVDMSLKHSSKYLYYKNFNKLELDNKKEN